MGKYTVEPEDTVEVSIYIDERGDSFNVLTSQCTLTQGVPPCTGNPQKPCLGKYNTCNAKNKVIICGDILGALGIDIENLPEGIIKETSKWRRLSYGVSTYIDSHSFSIDEVKGTRRIDFRRQAYEQIRVLLKEWTLIEKDETLKLAFQTASDNAAIQVLTPECMNRISKLRPAIMNAFLRQAIKLVESGGTDLKN